LSNIASAKALRSLLNSLRFRLSHRQGKAAEAWRVSESVPNKVGADIKEIVTTALNMIGGARYLAKHAEKNPAAFMGLVGKVLPLQLHASGGGALLLEQLLMAAQALRERAQTAALPAPTVIEASPNPTEETQDVVVRSKVEQTDKPYQ